METFGKKCLTIGREKRIRHYFKSGAYYEGEWVG